MDLGTDIHGTQRMEHTVFSDPWTFCSLVCQVQLTQHTILDQQVIVAQLLGFQVHYYT